jgi:NADH:ubiquinone oxidoreductase subunit 6 (subunit J)/ferredoxin
MTAPFTGLLKGLAVTLRTLTRPAVTAEYPDAAPTLPPRSRGVIALLEENCTVCMLCARECPDWCIHIDSHKETLPAEGGGRARQRNVLDRFAIDFSLCMYCGICCSGVHSSSTPAPRWPTSFTRRNNCGSGCGRFRRHRPSTLRHRPPRSCRPARPVPPLPAAAPNQARGRADMTLADVALTVAALAGVGSGLLAVTSTRVVHAALWLVVCLGALAGVYLVLGSEVVALVQLLVYVGAVVVLVLFALMLTRAPTAPGDDLDSPVPVRVLAALVAAGSTALVLGALLPLEPRVIDRDVLHGTARALGSVLFSSWVLAFELLSVLLLAALIAAIAVSRGSDGGSR